MDRTHLISNLTTIWSNDPELRFGQLLNHVVRVLPLHSDFPNFASITDEELETALALWSMRSRTPAPSLLPGPYWDTESPGCGSFMHGQPRDPNRIDAFVEALSRATGALREKSICAVITAAAGQVDVPLIEDGPLRRKLLRLSNGSDPAAGFRRLSDLELRRLAPARIIDYISSAREHGDAHAETTALAVLVFLHVDTIREEIEVDVPAPEAEEIAAGIVAANSAGSLFGGRSLEEFRAWLTVYVRRSVAGYRRRYGLGQDEP